MDWGWEAPPRADDGTRTRDPHLGKVMRYQLRYVRENLGLWSLGVIRTLSDGPNPLSQGGASGEVRGDQVREGLVDVHPQVFVAGDHHVVRAVQEVGQLLR